MSGWFNFAALIIGSLVSLIYRMSIKSTALVYLPFVWVAKTSLATDASVIERLDAVLWSPREGLRRWYAGVIIALTAIPVIVYIKLQPAFDWLRRVVGEQVMDVYVGRLEIRLWHAASLAAALITFFLWFFADETLRRGRYARPWRETTIDTVLGTALFFRGLLGVYTIGVTLCLLTTITWPDIAVRVFPWR